MFGIVWHIWVGVALTAVAVLACIGVLAYFMIAVQRQKYPTGKQRRHRDL